jgi:DNA mismatch endonuclease (patch repair protein)
MARDRETTDHLVTAGWAVLRFWEHEAPEDVAIQVAATVQRRRSELIKGEEA